MSELFHECGIAGIYYLPNHSGTSSVLSPEHADRATALIPRMLLDLQNRGQLAAGLSSYAADREQLLSTHKEVGSVIEAFRMNHRGEFEGIMQQHRGTAGIGHVRYATCGLDDRSYAQPFERFHGCKWKWFTFAFNGQLANYNDLVNELMVKEHYHLTRKTDTEVLMHCISYELRGERPDLMTMFTHLAQKFDGAYNLLYMNAMGEMVAVRDPLGIRPLCYAMDGPVIAFASESVALLNLGFTRIHSMEPGQIIVINSDGKIQFGMISQEKRAAHCFFEWIYFANVASELDGVSVYQTRARLGEELARTESLVRDSETIVVPVPDTAKAAADAMAFELGIPSVEGLIRNRYVGRTFIQGAGREDRVRAKYTPLRQVLEGKRVILVEDTIVRSTTMKSLINHMREKGKAKEIHVRVACPPIIAPCFYGIDMSTIKELFAPKFMAGGEVSEEEQAKMARVLGADSLRYLPIDSLVRAIGLPADHLCRACVTGEYPTPKGRELYQIALEQKETSTGERTYEKSPLATSNV